MFVSRDPIGYQGKLYNVFCYIAGMSTKYVDPLGLEPAAPGELVSDMFKEPFCCGGKDVNPTTQCCVQNTTKGSDTAALKDRFMVYGVDAKTRCQVCWRQAQVPGGSIGANFALFHVWLKCAFGEVGLGELAGGVPGEGNIPKPYPKTGVNDHTGQAVAPGSKCVDIDIKACCIARQMVPRATGKTCGPPPMYNCNTFVFDALKTCGMSDEDIKGIRLAMEKGTYLKAVYGHAEDWIGYFPLN
jgi:hypothetical protein